MRITAIFLVVALCAPCLVNAQQVEIGERVRVTNASGDQIVGEVQELDQNNIAILLEDKRRQQFSLSDIAELHISDGIRNNAKGGAIAGVAVGGLFGFATASALSNVSDAPKRGDDGGSGGIALLGAVVAAVPMALVGAGIGSLMKSEEWTEVSIDEMASLQSVIYLSPTGQMAIGARITF